MSKEFDLIITGGQIVTGQGLFPPVTTFELPPMLVNPEDLPPVIKTSDPDSFAHDTLKRRIPQMVMETIQLNAFPADIRRALTELHAELTGGLIRGLQEATPDKTFWDEVSRPYLGRTWLEAPWYWAETFCYRRILEATGYFQPGPWQGVDPFQPQKATEWAPHAAPSLVETTLRRLPADRAARFQQVVYASLWGNRIDLSYNVSAQLGRSRQMMDEQSNLLVDHSAQVWQFLRQQPGCHLALIADNAGSELLMDLVLIDFLLGEKIAARLDLYLKPQPFFVSDALPQDVEAGLKALDHGGDQARALQERLRGYLQEGRLSLRTHWFFPTSLFYFQLPADLYGALKAVDLVFLKGDANYRRLVGDAHWPPTAPFETVTAYFPTRLVALRTLKAEVVVGLLPGEAERLQAQDPQWRVTGQRGLIQRKF